MGTVGTVFSVPTLHHLSAATLRAADDGTPLTDACGESPNNICEWVFERTGGNTLAAGVADWIVGRPLSVALILLGAWLAVRIARRYLQKAVKSVVASDGDSARRQLRRLGIEGPERLLGHDTASDPALAARRTARAQSVAGVVGSTVTVAVWTTAVILVLGELGINLGPFIAGAGIVGVALGFGAQSLVKDCISGLFMLMEDQYGIGDVVDLGEASGVVEEIALRTTVLRGIDGTVWHVPNGEIQRVGNKSQLWSTAVVDLDVAYDVDLQGVSALMERTAIEVCESEDWADRVLDAPEVLGVEMLGADGITLRMVVKTAPGAQWALQRRLREAFKSAFDEAGVEIPFPQRTVWMRNADS